ncbi:MAG: cytochrome P450 [Solirubrobacterales bacterium]
MVTQADANAIDTPTPTPAAGLIGRAPPSTAGPIDEQQLAGSTRPPRIPLPTLVQVMRFTQRQTEFVFRARRELGEVFGFRGIIPGHPVITGHPDHVKSLFTAKPELVPSLTAESPLRPIVGKDSVLTAQGARHIRQRKLLLPSFHGEAVERYSRMIAEAAEREISKWPIGSPFELAPRMQAITLDVIMAGVFGIEGRPRRGTPEWGVRNATRQLVRASTWPVAQLAELMNVGRSEAVGLTKAGLSLLDKPTYEVISQRRAAGDLEDHHDIMSMLLRARTDDGEALSDRELRDELLTLVLAGHETTANSLAWTWERLTRTPDAYATLYDAVRNDSDDKAEQIEAVITETMRSRPVIPMIGRRVSVPWQLGEYAVPAGSAVVISIMLVHHREDLYPDPFDFKPRRWIGHKPGTYEWLPFGGGARRCIGAALAMAEQRVVLEAMVRRLDIEADRREPEHVTHRNVTMIPARGARAVIRARHAA